MVVHGNGQRAHAHLIARHHSEATELIDSLIDPEEIESFVAFETQLLLRAFKRHRELRARPVLEPEDGWLDVDELAQFINRSPSWVYRYGKARVPGCTQDVARGRLQWRKASVLAWINHGMG